MLYWLLKNKFKLYKKMIKMNKVILNKIIYN